MDTNRDQGLPPRPLLKVNDTELYCLCAHALGHSNAQIADHLCLARQTVKNKLWILTKKLKAKNLAHAFLLAIDAGLIRGVYLAHMHDRGYIFPLTSPLVLYARQHLANWKAISDFDFEGVRE